MYEWNTAQNEPIIILMLGLLESMLSKSNINIILLFHRKIHSYTRKCSADAPLHNRANDINQNVKLVAQAQLIIMELKIQKLTNS